MAPKVWLITGSNSGIGLALAHHVLGKGDKVIATARNLSKIPDSLRDAERIVLDLNSSDAEIRQVGLNALKIYGRIDVLVNNAGAGNCAPSEEVTDEDMKATFQTNIFGGMSLTRSLLPAFRAQKSGHIVNLSSVGGLCFSGGFGVYQATKAALEAISECLSHELAPFNIRVIIVEPGYFPTNWFVAAENTASQPETKLPGVYTQPSQGFGLPGSIPKMQAEKRQVGDIDKAAARIYEIVTGTGLATELANRKEWLRMPLGSDSGEGISAKLQLMKENIDAFEPIWRSTDKNDSEVDKFLGKV